MSRHLPPQGARQHDELWRQMAAMAKPTIIRVSISITAVEIRKLTIRQILVRRGGPTVNNKDTDWMQGSVELDQKDNAKMQAAFPDADARGLE